MCRTEEPLVSSRSRPSMILWVQVGALELQEKRQRRPDVWGSCVLFQEKQPPLPLLPERSLCIGDKPNGDGTHSTPTCTTVWMEIHRHPSLLFLSHRSFRQNQRHRSPADTHKHGDPPIAQAYRQHPPPRPLAHLNATRATMNVGRSCKHQPYVTYLFRVVARRAESSLPLPGEASLGCVLCHLVPRHGGVPDVVYLGSSRWFSFKLVIFVAVCCVLCPSFVVVDAVAVAASAAVASCASASCA